MIRRFAVALALLAPLLDARCDPSFSCSDGFEPEEEADAAIQIECEGCTPINIGLGAQHTCVSLERSEGDGTVACFGRNDRGQLGPNATADRSEEPQFVFDSLPTQVSGGTLHTCSFDAEFSLCWGANDAGLLSGSNVDARIAGWSAFTFPFTESSTIGAGAAHTCYLAGGTEDFPELGILCWGDNAFGQLGTIPAPYRAFPVFAGTFEEGSIVHMDAGGLQTCIFAEDLRCSGVELASDPVPTEPRLIEGVVAPSGIGVGATHACVIEAFGAVRCWGDNTRGQLGIGTIGGRFASPVAAVDLPAPAIAISCGGFIPIEAVSPTDLAYGEPHGSHCCAFLQTDEIHCWGANDRGQLGDGTRIDRASPVRVAIDSPLAPVDCGGEHTCVLSNDGLRCWGDNTEGQLGVDPDEIDASDTPLRVDL
jgi:alpha-tubulin suppressor-like RCC1 family protein